MCKKRKGDFCDCDEFPCDSIKRLDERYQRCYGMSEIENLIDIRDNGIDKFLAKQAKKYINNGKVFCVHNKKYYQKEKK